MRPRRPSAFLLLGVFSAAAWAEPALRVAPGFRVERVHAVSRESEGSWVALAVDPRGRLVVSDQYGPLRLVTLGGPGGTKVRTLDLPVGSAHGLAFVGDALYVTVAERVHGGPGLFRVTDANGDGELDRVELLQRLEGTAEHGPHAIVPAPDGRSLFVLGGNATRLPPLRREAARATWDDPTPLRRLAAVVGSETRGIPPGGWICQTDLDGRAWTLHSAGFRNHYGAAFNRDGELFTFDSDTENEINLPWYRPTRVLHAVSGADFGWRPSAAKVPDGSAATLPAVVRMGLGSPTGVTFGHGARFPARYVEALFVADWSFGRLQAVHLRPHGASYRGDAEEIVSGTPLPITALAVTPREGAMYFTTGGRRLQSALYRLTWDEGRRADGAVAEPGPGQAAREQRRALERFHGVADDAAVAACWPHLGDEDPFLRSAARRALESQPVAAWRERARGERDPRRALAALLALARAGEPAVARRALPRFPIASLPADLRREHVELLARTLGAGPVDEAEARTWVRELDGFLPSSDAALERAAAEVLLHLGAPGAVERCVRRVVESPVREEQLAFATLLRTVRDGWTPQLRQRYFDWLGRAAGLRGGIAMRVVVERIQQEALASVAEPERTEWKARLAAARETSSPQVGASRLAGRTETTAWTVDALVPVVEGALRERRDLARGRDLLGATGCYSCHALEGEGGIVGPDLTQVRGRMGVRDLLEAILEPSREISDQYGSVIVTLKNGRQETGRLVNQNERQLHLCPDLFDPSALIRIDHGEIERVEPAKVSLMPPGLLSRLTAEEIADLVAVLLRPAAR